MQLSDWKCFAFNDLPTTSECAYEFCFVGDIHLDDRSKAAMNYCVNNSKRVFTTRYSCSEITVSSHNVSLGTVDDLLYEGGSILVDATTLDVPELLKVLEWLYKIKMPFDVCYFEPEEYVKNSQSLEELENTYVISDDGEGIEFIPPFLARTRNSTMVVSLGFEGHRFGAIMESEDFSPKDFVCLIGVPAFKLGMEKTSFKMNIQSLKESEARILMSGANDPFETNKNLDKVLQAVDGNNAIVLAPFGTKPAALAMCVFAVNNKKQTGVIYDFAKRRLGRSTGVGMTHFWSFSFLL